MTSPETQSVAPKAIVIDGRTFRPLTETTYEQDMVIMQLLSDAGLLEYARNFNPIEGKLDKVAEDIVIAAFRSGKIFEILAATLVEENHVWSRNQIIVNGQFFSQLTKRKDKDALRGALVGVLFGFFVSGVASSVTSLKFSDKSGNDPEGSNSGQIEESPSSLSGHPLFGSSQDTTAPDTTTS